MWNNTFRKQGTRKNINDIVNNRTFIGPIIGDDVIVYGGTILHGRFLFWSLYSVDIQSYTLWL